MYKILHFCLDKILKWGKWMSVGHVLIQMIPTQFQPIWGHIWVQLERMTAAIAAFVRQNALVFIKIKKLYSQLGVWFAFFDIICSLKINFGERNIILLKCLLWIFCLFFSACLSCFSFNSPGFHVWFWGFFCLLGFGVFFPLFFLFIEWEVVGINLFLWSFIMLVSYQNFQQTLVDCCWLTLASV